MRHGQRRAGAGNRRHAAAPVITLATGVGFSYVWMTAETGAFVAAARTGYPEALRALAEHRRMLRIVLEARWMVTPDWANPGQYDALLDEARALLGEEAKDAG